MPIHLLPRLDRREFLTSLALGGAAVALGSTSRADDDKPPGWYALLADTHIAADPRTRAHGEVMADNLRAAIAQIQAAAEPPRGVFILGDLAYSNGQPGDYETFVRLLEPLRKAGIPLHLGLGNHDDRAHFRAGLALDPPRDAEVVDRQVSVVDGPGLRFVMLDSLDRVNVTPGVLGPRQLHWLGEVLDLDPKTPTIIGVHHNLGHSPNGLTDTAALLEVLRTRRQAKAVLFGHTHVWHATEEDGLHLINLPAVAYPFSPGQPLGLCRLEWTSEGASLKLHCVGGARTADGQTLTPRWRA